MQKIKIYKVDESPNKSKSELIIKYQQLKLLAPQIESWIFDIMFEFEYNGAIPFHISPTINITAILVKQLLRYCIPMFDTNPHLVTNDKNDKKGIWLQSEKDTRALDMSMREYNIPANQKFKINGLYPQYKRMGSIENTWYNTVKNQYHPTDLYTSGNWSLWDTQHRLLSAQVLPFTTEHPTIIKNITDDKETLTLLHKIAHEINMMNKWYLVNQTLLYRELARIGVQYSRSAKIVPVVVEKLDSFLTTLNDMKYIKFTPYGYYSELSVIDSIDLYQLYKLFGMTPAVQYGIDKLNVANKRRLAIMSQNMKAQETLLYNSVFQHIRNDMFDEKQITDKDKKLLDDKTKKYIQDISIPNNKHESQLIGRLRYEIENFVLDKIGLREAYTNIKQAGVKICEHLSEQVENYLKLVSDSLGSFNTSDIMINLARTYAAHSPVNNKYYCKKCGELLYQDDLNDLEMFGVHISTSSNADHDPIWYRIYNEAIQNMRFIKFSKSRNTKQFSQYIATTLESEMINKQVQLQKTKTKSLDDVLWLLILYINIYIMAIFTRLVVEYPKMVLWNVNIKGGRQQPKKVSDLTIAYAIIVTSKNPLISKIKDFSQNMIKSILSEAYQYTENLKFAETLDTTIEHDLYHIISWDPIYNYIKTIYITNEHPSKIEPHKLLGVKENAIASAYAANDTYAGAYKPIMKNYINDSYTSFLEFINQKIWITLAKPQSEQRQHYFKRYEYLHQHESEMDKARIMRILVRPRIKLYQYNRDSFLSSSVHISDVKCPDGERHDYSTSKTTYIYMVNGKKKEYTFKELAGRKFNGTPIGEKCARCGRILNASPTNISKELEYHNSLTHLFKYFENKCPVTDDIHNFHLDRNGFVGDAACKDCQYQKSFLKTQPAGYYKKWKHMLVHNKEELVPLVPTTYIHKQEKFETWKNTLASLLQVAKISQIPYNIWLNLGLTEHRNFGAIKLGKINPSNAITELESEARSVKLTGYIRSILQIYYIVKNHTKVSISQNIKALLDNDPPKVDLITSMPDILDNFGNQLEFYKSTLTKLDLCNWLLNTLASGLLQIRNLDTKLGKIAKSLFTYLVDDIIRSEHLVSEIEIQKMVISQTSREDEPIADDEADLVKKYKDAEDAEEDIDNSDPFSLDDVDIETTNTGNDDEEFMD